MKKVTVTNQSELDAIKDDFQGEINIIGDLYKIDRTFENAEVNIYGNAQISNVYGNAQISNVYGNAQISYVYGNAQIRYVYGNAQIRYVSGNVTILHIDGSAKVSTSGKNIVSYYNDKNVELDLSKQTTIVVLDRFNATWESYCNLYPISVKDGIATMFKTVRKIDDRYVSNHDSNFEYKIGEISTEKCDKNINVECSYGIHVSHKMWAIRFGAGWDNVALLEIEVDISKVVVPKECDDKVRTSEIKVIREIPQSEWYD